MFLRTLKLQTNDLATQRSFYVERLGLPLEADAIDGFTVRIGLSQLRFESSYSPERIGAYHFAFNIPENQIDEAGRWLAARQPLISDAVGQTLFDFQDWQAHSIYAFDPAGNVFEFIARHRLPNHSSEPFSSASLLNISEIGIATESVLAEAESFRQQWLLPVFDGAGSDTFTALGDDDGLLIVVKRGRKWYPNTDKIADDWPLALTSESDGRVMSFQTKLPKDSV